MRLERDVEGGVKFGEVAERARRAASFQRWKSFVWVRLCLDSFPLAN